MERVIAQRMKMEGRTRDDIVTANYIETTALRKWVEPEEVAATALFLASDAAGAITGATIKIDAGRR